ncbi:hypothetical protein CH330_08575 [candidate division WOR-3 bacterium JGI_Cruoil_03_51_56]|uniref:Octanoyltransferase n=1 Tax=candidate division WOR-3 bacterium JGI_Cruoil_03_51_56 TaxID=1973747 RepID=A0A235BQK4_UNCW3|nr:MAG: hypothetical protein CH330_08575 [candidate division WOR-3 bacterium JGI_Cruoil_03_51_56]
MSTSREPDRRDIAFLIKLGLVDYGAALKLQHRLWEMRIRNEIPDVLLLLEHPPVVTLGKHGKRSNLLLSDEELKHRGMKVYRIERGGDITFHGPGQLVGYPIYRLELGLVGIRRFMEMVEESLICALANLGVQAHVEPGYIGIWVEKRKIASIGVAVRRMVTFHGFALNVRTDLSWFGLMNPCGMQVQMTSVNQEGGKTDDSIVRNEVAKGFEDVFGFVFQRNLPRSLTSLTKGLSRSAISSA